MKLDITAQDRKSAVLTPSQLPCLADVPSVNLTLGCAQGCVYCYARSYSLYPGEDRVIVYANTSDKLASELRRKRRKPRCVYFSPSTDVFQPLEEVLCMAYQIFETLLREGVGVAFVTKGQIPAPHMALLCAHPELVQAQIGVITQNERLAASLEPNAAPPTVRFEQLRHLIRAGVRARVRVSPIIPGLTDGDDALDGLFGAAAAAGATEAAINALHLRPSIVASLRRRLRPDQAVAVLSRYEGAPVISVCGDKSRQTPLTKQARLALFARAREIAARHGIETHVCGCMNPDLTGARCDLAGEWQDAETQLRMC